MHKDAGITPSSCALARSATAVRIVVICLERSIIHSGAVFAYAAI